MQIKLLVEGGSMKPGPSLSQKLGPIGININKVIEKVNESTKPFNGLKVPVELDVDMSTKEFNIRVFSPPVSELLKKELGIEKGSGTQKKLQSANASIEQIISVAKTKLPNLLCRDLNLAVKTVIGTCTSLGVLIEGMPASKVGIEIDKGKYKNEIQSEATETSEEKKAELDKFFSELKEGQEKVLKEETAVKEAETAAKEEATKAAATTKTPEDKPTIEKKK